MSDASNQVVTESSLCDELEAYCKANKLPLQSADEIVLIDGLDAEHREWLFDFIERWEAFMSSTTVHRIPLKTPLELAGMFITALRDTVMAQDFEACVAGEKEADEVCDSNMVMANAFRRLHGRDTWLPSDVDDKRCTEEECDRDLSLWNRAVSIVRETTARGAA